MLSSEFNDVYCAVRPSASKVAGEDASALTLYLCPIAAVTSPAANSPPKALTRPLHNPSSGVCGARTSNLCVNAVMNRCTSRLNTTERACGLSPQTRALSPSQGSPRRTSPRPQVHGTVSPAPKSRLRAGGKTLARFDTRDSAHNACWLGLRWRQKCRIGAVLMQLRQMPLTRQKLYVKNMS
ncbi:hypothetical protein PMIN01_04803 [Paraphaeosphaeria minitans]|uniref:Uncharacterized protein n=1 Tax=Paraphaeosphaeria minitans TaxID=565426 RepID=A0A9P6GKD8_9PLEO|nr:hypothetical protein PMIN01_04803 [Paraphaeosphaeria minitans]